MLKTGAGEQPAPPDLPADIDHGPQEGNMTHLMGIQTLRMAVGLDGQDRPGARRQTMPLDQTTISSGRLPVA